MERGGPLDFRQRLAAAMQFHQSGDLAAAERVYGEILRDAPDHADAWHLLGVLAHQTGRNDAAVEWIRTAIAHNPRVPAFHNNLGNALKALGLWPEAAAAYRRALAERVDYVPAYYNLGVVLQAQNLFDEAAVYYVRAIAHQPNHVDAHLNLGNVLQSQGKLDEAAASYRRALSYRSDYAEVHGNLGNVLKAQGRSHEALTCYRQALRLKPDSAEVLNSLGALLLDEGLPDEAAAACRDALRVKPDNAEALCTLGISRKEQGRRAEALECFARALAIKPDYAAARLGLSIAQIPIVAADGTESAMAGETFSRALDDLGAWGARHPDALRAAAGSHQPFYLAYRPIDVSGLLCRYGDLIAAPPATRGMNDTVDLVTHAGARVALAGDRAARAPRARIHLAIVSGHVRHHPVWDMILRGLIEHLDRSRFSLALYHTRSLRDEETLWAASRVDRFVQGPKALRTWREALAEDRPDVIFYPEVGMEPACCALAALRLAPLQVAGWGHPVTTGLPTIDLFLSGELLEAPEADAHYRERLVRLPGTGVCTESIEHPVVAWDGPPRRTGVVRFALCQQPIKFDPADDLLLARIAKAVGPCEFWLVSPRQHAWAATALRERLAAAFRGAGLDPDAHLRMTSWLPPAEFAGFLDAMDIYLDCPAFSGYTTAWQAARRGLPIVTVEGRYLRQRLAAGLLRQIDLTEGVAGTGDDYVSIAVRWAHEWRQADSWSARRASAARAAVAADGNRAAVRAVEQTLFDELSR